MKSRVHASGKSANMHVPQYRWKSRSKSISIGLRGNKPAGRKISLKILKCHYSRSVIWRSVCHQVTEEEASRSQKRYFGTWEKYSSRGVLVIGRCVIEGGRSEEMGPIKQKSHAASISINQQTNEVHRAGRNNCPGHSG